MIFRVIFCVISCNIPHTLSLPGGPPTKLNDVLEGILVKAVIWPLRSHISKVLHEHDEMEADKLKNSMTVALSKPHEELG